jgi:hypothetical protein
MSRVTFIAGENINKGDAIALGNGYSIARKASATSSLYNSVIGFATHGAAAGSAVLVNRDTIFTSLSGLTPGQTSYVSYASGSVVSSYDGWYNSIPISSFATGDLLPIVDVSEISASDKNKSVTFGELFRNVLGGSASAPSIAFTGDQNTGIYSPGADQVAVATNGTGRLFVDASGNVGVGTSSVNALLEVNNSTAGGEVQRIEGNYSGSGSVILTNWRRAGGSVAAALKYNDDSSPLCMSIGTTTSHEFRIRTVDTDAITIDTSQRVGIGTSSPSAPLHVARSGGGVGLQVQNTSTYSQIEITSGGTDSNAYFTFSPTGTGKGIIQIGGSDKIAIDSSGRVGIGTTSPGSKLAVQ